MNSTFESNPLQMGRDAASLLIDLHEDSPQMARVTAAQQLLFPSSPRSLCDEIGLNWQAALRLQEEGWLSFSLENAVQFDEAQEAELRFVGAFSSEKLNHQIGRAHV